jgi:predicted RNA binding protein YcfA (HicA-like mRNA interferase family)
MLHLLAGVSLLAGLASGQAPANPEELVVAGVLTWPCAGERSDVRVLPMAEARVGFTLGPETQGRRVVVAVRARMESEAPGGYTQGSFAIAVNGEVMGTTCGPRARLLNRPMEFSFGAAGERKQVSGVAGKLGLIENQGSARWTLPWAPSFEAWLASPDYQPRGLQDPSWLILEITDVVHAGSFNYLTLRNEGEQGVLRCEKVAIHTDPDAPHATLATYPAAEVQAVYRRLYAKYLDRDALPHESSAGREWAYEMDLIEMNHGGSASLADLETLEDARRVIAPLKQAGYTAVMQSGLHMRYNHTDLWESRVVPRTKLVCQAAHEAGLKVMDHYDVPIFFARGYPFLLEGDHLDWTQRHLRTGTPTRMYCLNNPGFRRHFFEFTRRVQRESGIDAYQIDEVNFFGQEFCGCEHCRQGFTTATGFSLPREADSPVLLNDADPLWRLFLLWRTLCCQEFLRSFLASIHEVNPAAMLSIYTTSFSSPDRRGGIWPQAFACYMTGKEGVSRFPLENYRYCLADLKLRTGITDAFGHAPWMLWYPLTGSAARLCWGMSQLSNLAQWHEQVWTSSVRDLIAWPQKSRKLDFTTLADVALVFSEKSKNASMWNGHWHGTECLGWGEAMIEHNLQYHQLMEITLTPELLARYRVVILPQMTVVDAACRHALEAYVRNGGTLVVTGETGMVDEMGRPLADFALGEMMNLRFVDTLCAPFDVVEPAFTVRRDQMLYQYGARMLHVAVREPARSRVRVHLQKDGATYPGVIESDYGRGKVYTVAAFFGVSNFQMGLANEGEKDIFKTHPNAAAFMVGQIRAILGEGERVAAPQLPPGVVFTTWSRKEGPGEIDIHLLNVRDHAPLGPGQVTRRREVKFPLIEAEMPVRLRGFRVARAVFCTPDAPEPVACRVEPAPDAVQVVVPAKAMTMYGLLKIEVSPAGEVP